MASDELLIGLVCLFFVLSTLTVMEEVSQAGLWPLVDCSSPPTPVHEVGAVDFVLARSFQYSPLPCFSPISHPIV